MGGETTVGEFCPFTYGKGLPERDRVVSGEVPVYGSNGIVGRHNEALTSGPSVIIGRKGTVGAVHLSVLPCWPIDTTFYIEFESVSKARFVYYLLKTLDLTHMNSDSAVPGLNRDAAQARRITIVKEPQRDAIAYILGALDDKIELNRRMNETLEAMARAIFKSWFVDFDPVRARAEGRDTGLPKEIADLFPDRFEDSELGEIPKGWDVRPLPEVIEVNPKRKLQKGDMAPYLDMKSMPTRSARATGWYGREFNSGTKFINGDTLLARITPCLENGKTAFVDFLEDGQVGWGSTEYIVLHSKPPLPVEYSYFLARSDSLREHAILNMTGSSGRQRVPASCFDNFKVVVPPKDIATLFGDLAKCKLSYIKNNDEQSETLAAIRDALLPKLISGELRVPNAEKFLEGFA